jgi:hypothetical protein
MKTFYTCLLYVIIPNAEYSRPVRFLSPDGEASEPEDFVFFYLTTFFNGRIILNDELGRTGKKLQLPISKVLPPRVCEVTGENNEGI